MKKILSILAIAFAFIGVFSCEKAFSATTQTATVTKWDSAASLKRVNAVGENILSKNKLPVKVTFKVSEDETANAYANINQEIYVQKGLLEFVENDDELAAVISHEIGHIVNAHIQRQGLISALIAYFTGQVTDEKMKSGIDTANQLATLKMSRNDEYESDLTGADLMVRAGYNPLAMISVFNKICANSFDFFESHPSGDKRTMNVYDYLSYNYPTTVKKGFTTSAYSSFLSYAQPTIELRNSNPKTLAKFQKKEAKLKTARLKRALKVRSANPWATTYAVLKTLSAY
jgi:predicted Zn-dependent protease